MAGLFEGTDLVFKVRLFYFFSQIFILFLKQSHFCPLSSRDVKLILHFFRAENNVLREISG